jgi:hypothetical protein
MFLKIHHPELCATSIHKHFIYLKTCEVMIIMQIYKTFAGIDFYGTFPNLLSGLARVNLVEQQKLKNWCILIDRYSEQ